MAARYFSPADVLSVAIARDTRLLVHLYDGYWAKLLNRHFEYEPEISTMLRKLLTPQTYFIDGGANIGYWSMLMRHRAKRVIAIEASPDTFERLRENAAHNSADVDLIAAALWSEDGMPLAMARHHFEHAGATVCSRVDRADAGGWTTVEVPSITLATVLERYCPDESAPVIVKLDVEGAEIAAVEGSKDVLRRRRAVLLFEDHGSDPDCKVTRHLLNLGMVVTDAEGGRALSVDEVAAQKKQEWRGYNFVALWPEQSRELRLLGMG
jgi:FkbM family methyltransferase